MENFPWTRLPGVELPTSQKAMADVAKIRTLNPAAMREYVGDGNYGGVYQKSDEEMLALWNVAVEETRSLINAL